MPAAPVPCASGTTSSCATSPVAPIDLQGKSLQTRAPGATGVATTVYPLPPTQLPNNGTFLVAGVCRARGERHPDSGRHVGPLVRGQHRPGVAGDTTEPIDPNTRAGYAGAVAGDNVVDFYGWGNQATSFEGSRGPGTGTTTSAQRDDQRGQRQQHDGLRSC